MATGKKYGEARDFFGTNPRGGGPWKIEINFPVAAREIRVAAHGRALYWGRAQSAALGIVATGWMLFLIIGTGSRVARGVGPQLFEFQAWFAFVIAAMAFAATADSISKEKRDGTLGLLFLTHLRGADVVFGKLTAALTIYVSGALALLPLLTMSVLMGGVYFSQAVYILVSVLNMMLFSAAAGLFGSSLSVSKQGGSSKALAIVMFFCVAIPVLGMFLAKLGFSSSLRFAIGIASPVFAHQLASTAVFGMGVSYFWMSIGISFAMSCALLAAACWITPRSWQQRAQEPLLGRLAARYAAWTLRTLKARSPLGQKILDANAYEWLAARRLGQGTRAWFFVAGAFLAGAALILNFNRHNDPAAVQLVVCVPLAYMLQVNIKARIGGHAADRFAEDRETGAMELLLSTPLTMREMAAGEFRALRRLFFWPFVTITILLGAGFFLCLGGIDRLAGLFSSDPSTLDFRCRGAALLAGLIFFMAADSLALVWVGPYCALRVRNPQHGRQATMLLVLIFPIGMGALVFPFLVQSASFRAWVEDDHFYVMLLAGAGLLIANNVFWARRARAWLFSEARKRISDPPPITREAAPWRFSGWRPPIWRRLFPARSA